MTVFVVIKHYFSGEGYTQEHVVSIHATSAGADAFISTMPKEGKYCYSWSEWPISP